MGKGKFGPPVTSKSLKFFKFELVHDYVHEIYTSANFHFSSFSGGFSPDRWNITVLWLFPSWLYCIFFSGTRPGRTRGWTFAVYDSYDVFSPKDGPFGGYDNIRIHLEVISPQTHQNGAWIGNFKPNIMKDLGYVIGCNGFGVISGSCQVGSG